MELASDLATGLQLGSGITPLLLRLDAHLLGVASADAAAPPAPVAEAEEGAEGVAAPDAGSERAEAAQKAAKARTLVSELLAEGLVLLELQVVSCVGLPPEGETGGSTSPAPHTYSYLLELRVAEWAAARGGGCLCCWGACLFYPTLIHTCTAFQGPAYRRLATLRETVDLLQPSMDALVWDRSVTALKVRHIPVS